MIGPRQRPSFTLTNWHMGGWDTSENYTLYALTPQEHETLLYGHRDYPSDQGKLAQVDYRITRARSGRQLVEIDLIWVRHDLRGVGIGSALWDELLRLWPVAKFPVELLTVGGEALRSSVKRRYPARDINPGDFSLRSRGRGELDPEELAGLYRDQLRRGAVPITPPSHRLPAPPSGELLEMLVEFVRETAWGVVDNWNDMWDLRSFMRETEPRFRVAVVDRYYPGFAAGSDLDSSDALLALALEHLGERWTMEQHWDTLREDWEWWWDVSGPGPDGAMFYPSLANVYRALEVVMPYPLRKAALEGLWASELSMSAWRQLENMALQEHFYEQKPYAMNPRRA